MFTEHSAIGLEINNNALVWALKCTPISKLFIGKRRNYNEI